MRLLGSVAYFLLTATSFSQSGFEVASVKASQRTVGPDYNNHIVFQPTGITARNATIRFLVAEAYHLQRRQILGPTWLDQNEYDIEAKTAVTSRGQLSQM